MDDLNIIDTTCLLLDEINGNVTFAASRNGKDRKESSGCDCCLIILTVMELEIKLRGIL